MSTSRIPRPTPAKAKLTKAKLNGLPKATPAKAALVVDLQQLPVILTLPEIAAVYRVSPLTIRRGLQQNTFRPLPFDKYPYRWRREDVVRDLQTIRVKQKQRRHGFAATKAKRLADEEVRQKAGSR